MDAVSSTISKDWVGLILLPGISSVAGFYFIPFYVTSLKLTFQIECLSAVKVSVKDELTLSVSVAVGSTIVRARVHLSKDISLSLFYDTLFILANRSVCDTVCPFIIMIKSFFLKLLSRFTVILAWITHKPLSLLMDPFQSMASAFSYLYGNSV